MENNDDKPAPPAAKNDLLEELESIKGLLDDSFDDDLDLSFDIPILDDVVVAADPAFDGDKTLLNLEEIFNDAELEDLGNLTDQSAELALDDLDLSDSDLESLEIDDNNDIEIPDFKLAAAVNNSDIQTTKTPLSLDKTDLADPAFDHSNSNDEAGTSEYDDSLVEDVDPLDEDSIWLDDDPIADKLPSSSDITETVSEEEQQQLFDDTSLQQNTTEQHDIDLDFLIQELVDEFIPQIEDQLRRRLSSCSASVIKGLADKHLD